MANTLKQIAEKCGVSSMTVSRALRNQGPVKEATREKILAVAKLFGYLQGGRPGRPATTPDARPVVEVVLGSVGRRVPAFYLELLTAIEQCLAASGHDCVIRTCNGEYTQVLALRDALRRSSAIGVMIIGDFQPEPLAALLGVSPPALLVDHPGDAAAGADCESINFDNVAAATLAVQHLLSIGRQRIVLIRGPATHYFSREIERGYRAAHAAAGVSCRPSLIVEADFTVDGADTALSALIGRGIAFDAVFTNDEMAVGVYRTLGQHRLGIPGDVAVCGCDGLPIGQQLSPALTTVFLDYREMGRLAVEHLLKIAKTPPRVPCRIRLMPRFEKHDSA
jgi:DNA-binding LacI/PurR family transcriptional regulator